MVPVGKDLTSYIGTARVAVRVDASDLFGWGHARRCLTLASELARHGAKVSLVCRSMDDTLAVECRRDGIDLLVFSPAAIERCRDADVIPEGVLIAGDAGHRCAGNPSAVIRVGRSRHRNRRPLRAGRRMGGRDSRERLRESWQSMISPIEPMTVTCFWTRLQVPIARSDTPTWCHRVRYC